MAAGSAVCVGPPSLHNGARDDDLEKDGDTAELARAPDGTERTCASFELPVSKSTLTHHFRVMREAGLIQQVDRGNSRAACLCRKDIDSKLPGLLALLVADGA
ncbi:ArsR/SmtB family transcription factor [Pararhizobium sp.]|uniref:ArsR/SmtB family transcription factor n=1 Tax=Pararhizobium sp. TaxID=1977563 RepID=UPI003D11CFA5